MPGLVPGIHVLQRESKQRRGWPGTTLAAVAARPRMTIQRTSNILARAQRRLGGGAHAGSVNPGIVARLRSARDHLDVDEDRPLFGQDGADLLLENLQIGKRVHAAIAGRAREAGKSTRPRLG